MKKLTTRKSLISISMGVLITAASQVFSHFIELPDLARGAFMGIGIGISLITVMLGKLKPVH